MEERPCQSVWVLQTKTICRKKELPKLASFLNEREQQKANTFCSRVLRESYIVSRGFTKWALAQVVSGIEPVEVAIAQKGGGKPFWSSLVPKLDFNVSHCQEMVVVACAQHQVVGIDVEPLGQDIDLSIADSYFCSHERRQIRTLPAHLRSERFFEFWTLKEAYLKALGVGLSVGLTAVSFDLMSLPTIRFQTSCAGGWSFRLYQLADCKVALCLRGEGATDIIFYEGFGPMSQRIYPRQLGASF